MQHWLVQSLGLSSPKFARILEELGAEDIRQQRNGCFFTFRGYDFVLSWSRVHANLRCSFSSTPKSSSTYPEVFIPARSLLDEEEKVWAFERVPHMEVRLRSPLDLGPRFTTGDAEFDETTLLHFAQDAEFTHHVFASNTVRRSVRTLLQTGFDTIELCTPKEALKCEVELSTEESWDRLFHAKFFDDCLSILEHIPRFTSHEPEEEYTGSTRGDSIWCVLETGWTREECLKSLRDAGGQEVRIHKDGTCRFVLNDCAIVLGRRTSAKDADSSEVFCSVTPQRMVRQSDTSSDGSRVYDFATSEETKPYPYVFIRQHGENGNAVSVPVLPHVSFEHENTLHELAQKIGARAEIQTGNDEFDQSVYISAEVGDDFHHALCARSGVQSNVLKGLRRGWEQIDIFSDEAPVVGVMRNRSSEGVGAIFRGELFDDLTELTRSLPSLRVDPKRGGEDGALRLKLVQVSTYIWAAAACFGGVIVYVLTKEWSRLFWLYSALAGGVLFFVLFRVLLSVMRRRESAFRKTFTVFGLVASIGTMSCVVFFLNSPLVPEKEIACTGEVVDFSGSIESCCTVLYTSTCKNGEKHTGSLYMERNEATKIRKKDPVRVVRRFGALGLEVDAYTKVEPVKR